MRKKNKKAWRPHHFTSRCRFCNRGREKWLKVNFGTNQLQVLASHYFLQEGKKLKPISGVCELVPVWWRPHRWVLQGSKQALIDWFFSPCWWHGGIGQCSKALHHIFHYLILWIEHSIHSLPTNIIMSFTGSWTSVTFELWSQPKSFLLCRFGDFFCEEMFFVVLRSIQYNHTYDFRHFRHKGLT